MNDNHSDVQSKQIKNLVEILENAKSDPSALEKISKDPIGMLESQNIYVEDEFKEAVISQFEAISSTITQDAHKSQIKSMSAKASAPSAPSNLTVVITKEKETTPPEVLNALEFKVKPWGFVLVVREPAVKYIQGGGTITASASGGIGAIAGLGGLAAASSALGPIGITVGAIAGIIAAVLGIASGLITWIDEGKGVYLTWTWVQILPFLNITQFPIITPIK